MTIVREIFTPVPMGVDSSYTLAGSRLGGFLARTSGTITVTSFAGNVVVDAVPVTAGTYTLIPILLNQIGATVTLGGGASGTLML